MKIGFKGQILQANAQTNQIKAQSPKTFLQGYDLINKELDALNSYGKYISFKGKTQAVTAMNIENKHKDVGPILTKLRAEMKKNGLNALIVRSTDEYLNETVDKNQSQRIYVSNFTGSAGDIIIANDQAFLMVDSRYYLSADKEVDPKYYTVEKVGLDKDGNRKEEEEYGYQRLCSILNQLSKAEEIIVGFDPQKYSIDDRTRLLNELKRLEANVTAIPTNGNLVDKIRGGKPQAKANPLIAIPVSLTGESTQSKLKRLNETLQKSDIDVIIVNNLFDISYLTNLRGSDIEYNAAFKGLGIATKDKLYVFCEPSKVSQEIKDQLKDSVIFKPEDQLFETLKDIKNQSDNNLNIAYSSSNTTYDTYQKLESIVDEKTKLVSLKSSPIGKMRSIKNPIELASMKDGMNRADRAVNDVINYINRMVKEGKKVTEKDLEDKTKEAHFNHGANALSFSIIPAVGPNAAIVHYSDGNPEIEIKAGDLILLDTGGYYDAGYATDLTRSWLAGGKYGVEVLSKTDPEDLAKKKNIYSAVLKGSLKGIFAELPPGTTATDLDNIVREPITKLGHDFGHSVGHGVGIGVHENPPFITPSKAGNVELEEGMVFSIEPGSYIKDWGGVRFENLVTVKKHDDPKKAEKGWHQIDCMTFAPIDHNLLDKKILDKEDFALIKKFDDKVKTTMKAAHKEEKSLK